MSAKTLAFSNNLGALSLAAFPTTTRSQQIPDADGTLGLMTQISAGTASMSAGQVVFSNSNGISFGLSGSTVTAQMPAVSYWDNLGQLPPSVQVAAVTDSTQTGAVSFERVRVGSQIFATRLDVLANLSATQFTSTAGYQLYVGIFTLNASTASIASTGSVEVTFSTAAGGNVTEYGGQNGLRWRSVPLGAWSVTPGDYLLGFYVLNDKTNGFTFTWNMLARTSPAPLLGVADATSLGYFGDGVYASSAGTAPFAAGGNVSSLHMSRVQAAGNNLSSLLAQPYVRLIGSGP